MWVVAEIVVLAMLKDEKPSLLQYVRLQNELWYLFELFQCVGWVGKDKVVAGGATANVAEHIVANKLPIVVFQSGGAFSEVCEVKWLKLH